MMKISGIAKYWESVGFTQGKCYENPYGKQIYVCGEADTLVFGKTLMVEVGDIGGNDSFTWQPIDLFYDLRHQFNWSEIPIEKFQLCNYQNSENEITRLKDNIKEFDRKKKLTNIKNKIH